MTAIQERDALSSNTPSNKWTNVAIAVCLGIVGFYLWTEHRAHLFGALPYLLLLACPLMHLFMHRSHDHQDHSHFREHGVSSNSRADESTEYDASTHKKIAGEKRK